MAENPVVIRREEGKLEVLPLPSKAVAMRAGLSIGGIALLAAAAPFVGTAVVGAAGLLALGGFALVGVAVVMALPLIGQKYENRLLTARKAEAKANPVEQRQNSLLVRQQKLKDYKDAITTIGTGIKGMRRRLEDRKKARPTGDYARSEKSLKAMEDFFQAEAQKLAAAEAYMTQLKEVVEDEAFEYEFATDGQAAIAGLKGATGPDPMRDLLDNEASREIAKNFDQVFATVELDAILAQAKQIRDKEASGSPLDAIDAQFAEIKGGQS